MPKFEFLITADTTMSALVSVTANSFEEAQKIATKPSFYNDPQNVPRWELDEGNWIREVYVTEQEDCEVLDEDEEEDEYHEIADGNDHEVSDEGDRVRVD